MQLPCGEQLAAQACSVVLEQSGLSFQWEDESKTLQAAVYLRAEVLVSQMVLARFGLPGGIDAAHRECHV